MEGRGDEKRKRAGGVMPRKKHPPRMDVKPWEDPDYIQTAPPAPPRKEIRKYEDVVEVLADTVHDVREGERSAAEARAIASVCQVMLAAIEKQNKQNKPAEINGLAALKAISEGMSAGVAREILMSRDFSRLDRMGQTIDVTPEAVPVVQDSRSKAAELLAAIGVENETEEVELQEVFESGPVGSGKEAPGDIEDFGGDTWFE